MKALKDRLPGSEPDGQAIERVWQGVQAPAKEASRWPLRLGFVLASVVAILGWLRTPQTAQPMASVSFADGGALQPLQLWPQGALTVDTSTGPASLQIQDLQIASTSGRFLMSVEPASVQVAVERGEVHLQHNQLQRTLKRGEDFVASLVPMVPPRDAGWLELAQVGKFSEAAALLGSQGLAREAETSLNAEERLLLADVALAGAAVPLAMAQLQQVVAGDSAPAVRALASWRMGLRHSERGAYADAARAFEVAVGLGVPGVSPRDAAHRIAETWELAGDAARAWPWRQRAGP